MRIIIASGGSGGHIFPALDVARELKKNGHEVLLAGSFGRKFSNVINQGFTIVEVSARGLVFIPVWDFLSACFTMIKGFFQSWRLMTRFRPDVVCGFGGYGAFPVVLNAVLLGRPTVIHEQNVVPGKANALLSRYVRKIAVSFEESRKYFNPTKTVLTGCPAHVKPDGLTKEQSRSRFKLGIDKFTVLVSGGSQGSHRINEVFLQTLENHKEFSEIQVIHATGEHDFDKIKQKYSEVKVPARVFRFLEEINIAYQAADLIVSRAGASTITEIAMFHLPSVLVPYPGAEGHQRENACVLMKAEVSRIIEEKDLDPQSLGKAMKAFMTDRLDPQAIGERVKSFYFPDASQRLAKEIVQLGFGR